jgi:anthranilate synthase component 1
MAHIVPSREEFIKKAEQGNLIPVYREIVADLDTPVSAFKKIGDARYAFLLESVEGGENIGRYSFLGANPHIIFRSKKHEVEVTYANGNKQSYRDTQPLDRLRDVMAQFKPVMDPTLPPFCGGAVGYISYDEIRNIEPVGDGHKDDLKVPDIYFIVTDSVLIFDHVRHRLKILVNAHVDDRTTADQAYEEAVKRIGQLHGALARPLHSGEQTLNTQPVEVRSNFSQDSFQEAVEKCKEYIAAGDVFQVVISQRFHVPISCDAFEVYRALRTVNPSPYMFYLKFDDLRLAGSSPEILVRVNDGEVQVRPIAGTRKRGETKEADAALEQELLADPKECAEHIMLVDLGRNDCGRVCDYGSVRVDDLMVVERYSHVMHIVSNVRGKLDPKYDAFDVFKAAFPAGTVSGAPKIRAMQIIDEIEPFNRGTYAGSVGYFSFNGNLDSCITIRTVLVKGEDAYIQAGAGIVADSNPVEEYKETINKASAMIRAIEIAEYGLE